MRIRGIKTHRSHKHRQLQIILLQTQGQYNGIDGIFEYITMSRPAMGSQVEN